MQRPSHFHTGSWSFDRRPAGESTPGVVGDLSVVGPHAGRLADPLIDARLEAGGHADMGTRTARSMSQGDDRECRYRDSLCHCESERRGFGLAARWFAFYKWAFLAVRGARLPFPRGDRSRQRYLTR